jgi:hypothetical protein
MGVGIEALQVWMLYEGFMMWSRAKGVLPEPLPPLEPALAGVGAGPPRERGGRSC